MCEKWLSLTLFLIPPKKKEGRRKCTVSYLKSSIFIPKSYDPNKTLISKEIKECVMIF